MKNNLSFIKLQQVTLDGFNMKNTFISSNTQNQRLLYNLNRHSPLDNIGVVGPSSPKSIELHQQIILYILLQQVSLSQSVEELNPLTYVLSINIQYLN